MLNISMLIISTTSSVRFYKAFQTAGFELFSTLSEFAKTSYISEQRGVLILTNSNMDELNKSTSSLET